MTPEHLFDRIEAEAANLASARAYEMELEDGRPAVKQRAILRLVGTTNPVTQEQRKAAVATIIARAKYETAKLRAGLALNAEVAA